MLKNGFVLLIVAGLGYWLWTAVGQEEQLSAEELRLQENELAMHRCLDREASMNAAAAKGGVEGIAEDSQSLCAEKLGLFLAEGQWRNINVDSAYR